MLKADLKSSCAEFVTPAKQEHILKTLLRLWSKLSPRRREQFLLLGILMLIGGLAEVVSLGAVIPFLAALASPEKVLSHQTVATLFAILRQIMGPFGFSFPETPGPQVFVPVLAGAFALAALGAGAIRLLLLWAGLRLAHAAGADLSLEVYRRTLNQPYSVHVCWNSSAIISNITTKVGTVGGVLAGCLTVGTSIIVVTFIVLALFAIHPGVAIVAALSLGLSYAATTIASKKRLFQNSSRISQETTQVVKALQEGLGGIRDILLDGTQNVYCQIYQKADLPLRRALASNIFIAQSPRFIMEAIGMILFAGLALGLAHEPKGIVAALPMLGALALGAQRLLPALQQGYAAWTGIQGSRSITEDVLNLLDQPVSPDISRAPAKPLSFKKTIRFECVKFRYSSKTPWVLDGLSFKIPRGSRVGFVGKTGTGKSTCLDLLMGLLEPNDGRIFIDEQPLCQNNLRAWQGNIAHVPQAIYLSDSTLAENIAFGVEPEKIDMKRVKEAAHHAHIADFIESSSQGYQALVGERGIRLSGGQRQRIGIARALYKQATVLVFDEATSALDQETERAVMEAIEDLSPDLTILIIAHRLTTLKNCTQIIELGNDKA